MWRFGGGGKIVTWPGGAFVMRDLNFCIQCRPIVFSSFC